MLRSALADSLEEAEDRPLTAALQAVAGPHYQQPHLKVHQ